MCERSFEMTRSGHKFISGELKSCTDETYRVKQCVLSVVRRED